MTVPETNVYKMGTIILIYPIDNNLKLNTIQVYFNQSDYVFNESLTQIKSYDSSSSLNYFRVCLKVLTTRYYFNSSNQTFNISFNESGTFNLDVYMYDSKMNFVQNSTIANIQVTECNNVF